MPWSGIPRGSFPAPSWLCGFELSKSSCRPPGRVSVMVKSDRPWKGGSSQGCQHISVSSPKPQDSGEVVGDPHPPLGEPLSDRGHANKWPQAQRCSPSRLSVDFRRLWPPEYCPMGLKGQRTFQHACNIHLGHRRAESARATPSSWESDSGARSAYCFSQGKGELSSCTEIGDSPAPMPTHSALSIALPPYAPASQISPSPL